MCTYSILVVNLYHIYIHACVHYAMDAQYACLYACMCVSII